MASVVFSFWHDNSRVTRSSWARARDNLEPMISPQSLLFLFFTLFIIIIIIIIIIVIKY